MQHAWKCAIEIAKDTNLPWEEINGKRFLITGSTGLIGAQITRVLIARSIMYNANTTLILPVRSLEKAERLFDYETVFADYESQIYQLSNVDIKFIPWHLGESFAGFADCDFVVHAACITSSYDFLHHPVEVSETILDGTKEFLKYVKRNKEIRSVILSTMEVYGRTEASGQSLNENDLGVLNPAIVRNSYPIAKLESENLAISYVAEYGIQVAILRLAQTFGPGVNKDDKRAFAEFAKLAVSGKDIILFSDGTSRNSYVSVNDVVSAIIIALVKGRAGEIYNVANESTFCSVYQMADTALSLFAGKDNVVKFGVDEARANTFRTSSILRLDSSKIKLLGWCPKDSLEKMYRDMVQDWN